MQSNASRLVSRFAILGSLLLAGCGDVVPDDVHPSTSTGDAGGGASTSATSASSAAHGTGSGPTTSGSGGPGGSGGAGGQPIDFQDAYPLDAQFPEGGAYDPSSGAFYVGSLADGTVHRVSASTGVDETIFTETAPGTWWTLGMDVDVARRRLWVCAMDDSVDPRAGSIWIFDLETGARLRNYALADAADDASCTDVGVTADGVGYVGDREQGNVYQVDFDGGPTLFTSSPDLATTVIGQNAMVVLPDQSALISLLYLPSGLARIDLASGDVTTIDISGPFSDSDFLGGADGMTYANGSLYVAFTTRFARVTPTLGDWSQVVSTDEAVPSGMTDVLSTPGGLYLLNGQSVRFAIGLTPDPFRLVRYEGSL